MIKIGTVATITDAMRKLSDGVTPPVVFTCLTPPRLVSVRTDVESICLSKSCRVCRFFAVVLISKRYTIRSSNRHPYRQSW